MTSAHDSLHVYLTARPDESLAAWIEADSRKAGIPMTSRNTRLCGHMSDYLQTSRGTQTVKKYTYSFKKWKTYCANNKLVSLPAQPVCIALYLTEQLDAGASAGTLESMVYSIKWHHGINGLDDPTKNTYITNILESAKRMPKTRVSRKDPVTDSMLSELCLKYIHSTELLVIRDLTMILISYAGFLRYDELSHIRCDEIEIHSDFMRIHLPKSKTDKYREGNEVLIAAGGTNCCPVNMLQRYMSIAKLEIGQQVFLFRPAFKSKECVKLVYKDKPLSYTRAREVIVSRLREVGEGLNLGLHSMRAGGASKAANSNVNDRCWKRHGRWAGDSSKDRYVKDSLEMKLHVSQSLQL